MECLSGIPGTIGGTPIQNVGAYGQEIADTIESVTVFDTADRGTGGAPADQCRFAYRMSRFKQEDAGRFIVCDVSLQAAAGRVPLADYPDVIAHLEQAGDRVSHGGRRARSGAGDPSPQRDGAWTRSMPTRGVSVRFS